MKKSTEYEVSKRDKVDTEVEKETLKYQTNE